MTDPIADMLTRIRNAIMVNKDTVEIPSSNMKKAIADIMLAEGFVSDVKLDQDDQRLSLTYSSMKRALKEIGRHILRLYRQFATHTRLLKYAGKGRSVINGLKRISKPGLRAYAGVEDMPKVLNGLGIAVLSTNKGIMTDKQAKAANVGGEVLCYIW